MPSQLWIAFTTRSVAGKNILNAQLRVKLHVTFLQQLRKKVYILLEERNTVKPRTAKADMWSRYL